LDYSTLTVEPFGRRFFRIEISFAVLAALLFVQSSNTSETSQASRLSDAYQDNDDISTSDVDQVTSRALSFARSIGRKFIAAGCIVVMVTATVGLVEMGYRCSYSN
jgi:hypothetical protein